MPTFGPFKQVCDVRIALKIYRPEGEGRFPALFVASPYQYDTDDLPALPLFLWRETGPIEWYVQRGYAYVRMDVRGSGKSEGVFGYLDRTEQQDCCEVIEWIAKGLKDEDPEVRAATIESLRFMEHPDANDVLVTTLRRDKKLRKNPELYEALIKAVCQHADPKAFSLIADFKLNDETRAALDEGEEHLQRAEDLGLFPDERLHRQRAWLALTRGDAETAEEHLRTAISLEPRFARPHYQLGRLLADGIKTPLLPAGEARGEGAGSPAKCR